MEILGRRGSKKKRAFFLFELLLGVSTGVRPTQSPASPRREVHVASRTGVSHSHVPQENQAFTQTALTFQAHLSLLVLYLPTETNPHFVIRFAAVQHLPHLHTVQFYLGFIFIKYQEL